ncbi:MAG: endonuclease/exonuclease/phosphatase family protein [Betaproteobacteria bacterium]|nr:endonuclease/exonuclease/phosphatase family protein [Betaproteobacteria bacterium]
MSEPELTPAAAPPAAASAAATHQRRIAQRFGLLTVLVLIATLACGMATWYWVFELATHFTPAYCLVALLCAVVLGLIGAWRWMLLALALTAWHGFALAQVLLPAHPAGGGTSAQRLSVMHFNVNVRHGEPNRIVTYLQRNAKTIDVVALFEATPDWSYALDELKDLFPHQVKHLEDSPFGIALISKHPIDYGAVSFIPSEYFPHIEATLKLPGRSAPLAMFAIHPPPPISSEMAKARNVQLAHVAQLAKKQAKATPIVVGDFNVTPFSPYFKRFLKTSGLYAARNRLRLDNIWPVTFDRATLGLAIDHSLAHPSLKLIKRTIGPDLGSDHLPVTVTFGY